MTKQRAVFMIPKGTKDKLAAIAAHERRTMSAVIARLIDDLPHPPKQENANDDDWDEM